MSDRQPWYRRQLSPFWRMARLWAALLIVGVMWIAAGLVTGDAKTAWLGVALLVSGGVVAGLAYRFGGNRP